MKTKLGIREEYLAVILFFSAMAGITPLVLVAGYILICETGKKLKAYALVAFAIYFLFLFLSEFVLRFVSNYNVTVIFAVSESILYLLGAVIALFLGKKVDELLDETNTIKKEKKEKKEKVKSVEETKVVESKKEEKIE